MEKCGVKAELFERLKKEQLNLPDDQINPFKSGDYPTSKILENKVHEKILI